MTFYSLGSFGDHPLLFMGSIGDRPAPDRPAPDRPAPGGHDEKNPYLCTMFDLSQRLGDFGIGHDWTDGRWATLVEGIETLHHFNDAAY